VLYLIAGLALGIIMVLFPQVNIRLFSTGLVPRSMKWVQVALFAIAVSLFTADEVPAQLHAHRYRLCRYAAGDKSNGPAFYCRPLAPYLRYHPQHLERHQAHLPARHMDTLCTAVFMASICAGPRHCGLFFVFGVYLLSFYANRQKILSFITLLIASVLLYWLLTEDDEHGLITRTEEGTVIVYYVLAVLALLSSILFLQACHFTVYAQPLSLVGWVPAFLVFLILSGQVKKAFAFSATGLVCLVILFILPFGWELIHELAQLPGKYVPFAARVWNDSPEVFSSGAGMARFFGPNRIALQHTLLVSLSFGVPVVFMIICHYVGKNKTVGQCATGGIENMHGGIFTTWLMCPISIFSIPLLLLA